MVIVMSRYPKMLNRLNSKNKVIIVITFLVVVTLLVITTFKKSANTISKPTIANIPNLAGKGFSIKSKIDDGEFAKLPTQMSIYSLDKAPEFDKNFIERLKSSFGFKEDPISANDVFKGETIIYKKLDESLTIRPASRELAYLKDTSGTFVNKQLTQQDLESIAKKFLKEKLLLDHEYYLSFITYYKNAQLHGEKVTESTKSEADLILVNLTPIQSSLKIITLNPESSPIAVWIRPDATVTKVQAKITGSSSEDHNKIDILSFENFNKSLQRAIIVSAGDGEIHLRDLEGRIEEVLIDNIELAYLLQSTNSEVLSPIFLLTGQLKFLGSADTVPVVLYLPAVAF